MEINSTESSFPVSSRWQEVQRAAFASTAKPNSGVGACVKQIRQHSENAALHCTIQSTEAVFTIIVVVVGYEIGELTHFDIPTTFQQCIITTGPCWSGVKGNMAVMD